MSKSLASAVAWIAIIVLVIHAIIEFRKLRWVTAVVELAAAIVILYEWWVIRRAMLPGPIAGGATRPV